VTRIVGSTACGGWAAVVDIEDTAGEYVTWLRLPTISHFELDVDVIAVDMPIGLPRMGRRECDLSRRSSRGRTCASSRTALRRASSDATPTRPRATVPMLAVRPVGADLEHRRQDPRGRRRRRPRLVEVHPSCLAQLAGAVLPSKTDGRAGGLGALAGRWLRCATPPGWTDSTPSPQPVRDRWLRASRVVVGQPAARRPRRPMHVV
jgi:hypothetical protein